MPVIKVRERTSRSTWLCVASKRSAKAGVLAEVRRREFYEKIDYRT